MPYPSADSKFIINKLLENSRTNAKTYMKSGKLHSVQLAGDKPVYKNTLYIKEDKNGEVSFKQATGLAALYGFMGALLDWYLAHKQWKEGEYI